MNTRRSFLRSLAAAAMVQLGAHRLLPQVRPSGTGAPRIWAVGTPCVFWNGSSNVEGYRWAWTIGAAFVDAAHVVKFRDAQGRQIYMTMEGQ